MSIDDDYKNRNSKGGYVVPMSKEKYAEWSETVKKAKEEAYRHSKENKNEAKLLIRPK
jgi:hypothetical protein